MNKRLIQLEKRLKEEGLDAILISKKENVFYFSGFRGEGSLFVAACGNKHLITDSRFTQQASEELDGFNIASVNGSPEGVLKKLISKEGVKKLAFESKSISQADFTKLQRSLRKIKMVPEKEIIQNMRIIKDGSELGCLKKAISIIAKANSFVRKIIRPGMTEEALSAKINSFLLSNGADEIAFQTIAASNPRSSYPHAVPSRKRLGDPSAVLVDMGCVYKRYFSDLTRMFFLGKISAKFKALYNIVKTAQERALKKIKPGIRISEIDRYARGYIADKGFGKFFIHSLGHGIGLEVHEPPTLSKKAKGTLKPGMVFTVEPGIYIPLWGGVRVEDIALVTDTGCEVLTRDIPK